MKLTHIAFVLVACSDHPKVVPQKPPRNLGQVFVEKYMVERFHILDKPTCEPWESSSDVNDLQSVMCSIGDTLAVYCHGGGGKAPACELVIDKRQPAAQPPPSGGITEAAHEAAKQRAQPRPLPAQPKLPTVPKK